MGYFSNGFVFTTLPDFEGVGNAIPNRWARGYKHNQNSIWLLDLWRSLEKPQRRREPFCEPAGDGFQMDLAVIDGATREFLDIFERLLRAVSLRDSSLAFSSTYLALAVAAAARCPTFFFAADDEETDMGCNAIPGSLISFGCRLDRLCVEYNGEKVSATPLNYDEDDDEDGMRELIAAANTVPGLSVQKPRTIEGGQISYEHPVAQWPEVAGDPTEILGLGTWDPLLNIEQDFRVVYEKTGR